MADEVVPWWRKPGLYAISFDVPKRHSGYQLMRLRMDLHQLFLRCE